MFHRRVASLDVVHHSSAPCGGGDGPAQVLAGPVLRGFSSGSAGGSSEAISKCMCPLHRDCCLATWPGAARRYGSCSSTIHVLCDTLL
eukprot:CAMPEP_0204274886 /NCGR_PEP_ID=MMETSP0468-20130131/25440_1 /ASSEMBLY_ACC=CAM_ASM_000383 /TAXON_ID=2969 /ORGANISM="Oxyrrhis marina" /LENGTH=87 /DNA_ID=CAMNT_0051251147 /DNA_START=59 /DNA_END=319 /DNA_ORIENTATION=-